MSTLLYKHIFIFIYDFKAIRFYSQAITKQNGSFYYLTSQIFNALELYG